MATKLSGLRVSFTAVALVLSIAQVPSAMAENTQNDSRIQAAVTKSLSNSRFKNVHVSVENGVVSWMERWVFTELRRTPKRKLTR